jgi:hypothetical protein
LRRTAPIYIESGVSAIDLWSTWLSPFCCNRNAVLAQSLRQSSNKTTLG